ncbi:MAG: hypothetical protein QM438_09755 [Euryarchaeota archaeon]|nr:hypothetical protein [Euryarchaeota archaeon]
MAHMISVFRLPAYAPGLCHLYIGENPITLCDTMVSFKVDADARAIVQGSEDLEKHPIVAKVKGSGKDGALSVQVGGDDSSPISARISGDSQKPIALEPIKLAPITVVPDLKEAAQAVDFGSIVDALTRLSQGVKVNIGNPDAPLSIALGKIPVDLNISVSSPNQETVFRVEIKGFIGE